MNRHNTYSEYKTKSKHLTGAPVSSTLRSETHSCQKMTILGMTNTDKFNIRNTLCCHLTETWYFRNTFKKEHTLLPETQYFRNKFKQEHTLLPETHSNLNKEICKAKRRKISYKWHCLIGFLANVRKFRIDQYMSNRCWLARWWFSWGAPKL